MSLSEDERATLVELQIEKAIFGKRFIKTGIMPVSFGQFISRLEQLRERGDYNCS